MFCCTHGGAFTVYPTGFAPYLRRPMVGLPVRVESPCPPGETVVESQLDAFVEGSAFASTLDVARDNLGGVRDSNSAGWLPTQKRQVTRSASWLGLASGLTATGRTDWADALGIGPVELDRLAGAFGATHDLVQRGRTLAQVLDQLASGDCLVERLAWAGYLAGFWGKPFFWLPSKASWSAFTFRRSRTASRDGPGR